MIGERRCFVSGRSRSGLRDDKSFCIQKLLQRLNVGAAVPELEIFREWGRRVSGESESKKQQGDCERAGMSCASKVHKAGMALW